MTSFRIFVLTAALLFMTVEFVFSQEDGASSSKSVEEKVDHLDQKVRILERRFELQQEGVAEKTAEKTKEGPSLVSGKEGFSIQSSDGQFQLRFRGVIQADARFLQPGADTFVLSRVRPILEGTLYRNIDFKIIPDFGQGKTVIQDAYFDLRFLLLANIQIGKSKAPFGLERLQADTDLRFVERALPTDLVPNRDIGLELYGETPSSVFAYAVGVFNGVPDGGSADIDSDTNKDVVGRIFLQPFKRINFEPIQGFGAGIASSYGVTHGTLTAAGLPSYITVGQQVFFQYRSGTTATSATLADGARFRISPQAYYYWGSFGLIGEYVRSSQELRRDPATEKVKNTAWQATVSYLLTGEKNSYGSVSPLRPFDPGSGKWGAFEVAARYNVLTVDRDAFPLFADPTKSAREAKAKAAGVNWYLNKVVKFMFDYELTEFEGGAVRGNREKEKAFLGRSQIAF
ncbi:MAG: porin [Nitrospirae bacterium]|nr:porin [Candidatus Manganitrophaceae bacterium]